MTTHGFITAVDNPHRFKTSLNLEDWVADMIDEEILRQTNHKEYEKQVRKKKKMFCYLRHISF